MSVTTNAFWLSVCRIAADVLSFVLFAAISRSFGPAGAGEYSFAFVIASLAAMISTAGLEEYGIREYVRLQPQARHVLWKDLLTTQAWQLGFGCTAFAVYLIVARPAEAGAGTNSVRATA